MWGSRPRLPRDGRRGRLRHNGNPTPRRLPFGPEFTTEGLTAEGLTAEGMNPERGWERGTGTDNRRWTPMNADER